MQFQFTSSALSERICESTAKSLRELCLYCRVVIPELSTAGRRKTTVQNNEVATFVPRVVELGFILHCFSAH